MINRLPRKQSKKMAKILGVSAKELDTVMEDLQKMELLRHISGNLWEVYNGTSWHKIRI